MEVRGEGKKDRLLNDELIETTAEILKALSHPVRLKIVDLVRDEPLSVGELQKELGLAQATVSQHIKVLKNAKILECRPIGTQKYYKVGHPGVRSLLGCLAQCQRHCIEKARELLERME